MTDQLTREQHLQVARLDGTARRLLDLKADKPTCLAKLHEITTDPVVLAHAAGTSLGGWQQTQHHDGDRVARMLTAASADETIRDQIAQATRERLRRITIPGRS